MAELLAIQQKMTGWVAQLESITLGSGCYLNEVTPPPPPPTTQQIVNLYALIVGEKCRLLIPFSFLCMNVGRFPGPGLENHILRRQLRSPKGDQGEVGSGWCVLC